MRVKHALESHTLSLELSSGETLTLGFLAVFIIEVVPLREYASFSVSLPLFKHIL
jgi:hypothetical protein